MIKKLYVQKSALPMAESIIDKININYELCEDDSIIHGDKDTLLIAYKKSNFIKPCPCSKDSNPCGYYNLNIIEGCFFNCTYCILQLYLKDKPLTIYANINDALNELENWVYINKKLRIGTGELSDSMCLEEYTGFIKKLITFFKNTNITFEVKTKDHRIDSLLSLNHNNQTIISYSLNPQKIIEKEEKGASAIFDRINAMKEAIKAGYHVGFHFDPVIIYEGWEKDYEELICLLRDNINKNNVKLISIGLLRFPYLLKSIIRQRHQDSNILLGELIKNDDGKFRYFIKIRRQAYNFMLKLLEQSYSGVYIYLCMDTPFVWEGLRKPINGN